MGGRAWALSRHVILENLPPRGLNMEILRRTLASLLFVTAVPALASGQGFDVIFEDGFDGCPGAAKYVYL